MISLTQFLEIPALGHAQGTLRLPGSKSITNRALLLSALARGNTKLHHLLWSDDTRYMSDALKALGIGIGLSDDCTEAVVCGQGGNFTAKHAELFIGNSGTSIRFLTAASALACGDYTFTGVDRMKERPIRDLVEALAQIGAKVEYLEREGFPPILLHANGLEGGTLHVRGNISSQYLTAILLAAPCMKSPLTIEVDGDLISKPYVEMTVRMMTQFGASVENLDFKKFRVENSGYTSPGEYDIEGDASSASYALAAAAISDGSVTLEGLGEKSIQGDIRFVELLCEMGAQISFDGNSVTCSKGTFPLNAIDKDLSAIPDAAMTAAVLCLFARGTSRIRGIRSWKVKETDRILAMQTELLKVGAKVLATDDSLTITPPEIFLPATFHTYQDHRMAMCLSLVAFGLKACDRIRILDPRCVEKTYPAYWKDFSALTGAPLKIQDAE